MLLKFIVFGVVALIFWFSDYQAIAYIIIGFMVLKSIDILHRRAGGSQTVTLKQKKE